MSNLIIKELTKANKDKYLNKVVELEKTVLESMEKEGKIGQLFITGEEGIAEYVESKNNTVMIAIDEKGQVHSAAYITQGQKPFTYNDITKYFKYGNKYQQYIKSLYPTKEDYQKDMLETYKLKIEAYKYAKKKILEKNPQFKDNILLFLGQELNENGFHEKSELREEFNQFMSEYIEEQGKEKKYEMFYWVTSEEIAEEFGKKIDVEKVKSNEIKEYERLVKIEEEEYKEILKNGRLMIYEQPEFDENKYYNANTNNTIEIDTYITNPKQRHEGTARKLVYEGIKKHIEEYFKNEDSEEIYLCSTLHRENLSSKYVSEFFGLTDSLFVNRRQGRDREVHICKIKKEDATKYLEKMQDKLIVLYGYNPENKEISNERKIQIIKEQLRYEKQQFKNLNKIRHSNKDYFGNLKDMKSKASKIIRLKGKLKEYKCQEGEGR